MDLDLQGRVAIVTAAGSGIGLATARALAAEGVHVIAADLDPSPIDGTVGVTPLQVDLLAPDSGEQLAAAALERHQRIDILVNALGGPVGPAGRRDGFLAIGDQDWHHGFDLNVMGMVRACRAVIPHLAKHAQGSIVQGSIVQGSIISIASNVAREPSVELIDYSAQKAAVLSLSKSLSLQFAPAIRSNAVSPGPTRTPGLENWIDEAIAPAMGITTAEALEFVGDHLPTGRLAEPEDLADVVVFLASDRARQITGAEYTVNGGMTHYA